LVADTTNSVYFPAEMRCGDGAFASVGMRRKRSGGTQKVGFKVDINWQVQGQSFFGLKKLSFENGISEGSGEVGAHALMSEYLGWRLMALSGAITGHAALSRVKVNDTDLGVYVNVEQVDKRFLSSRIGDDSGWLYKKSGSADDGYKTNEDMPNPYEDYFCFWKKSGCAMPTASELASSLPEHLDIQQMLRVAAVNALMANTDTLLQKDNNYIFYDRAAGPRLYFPWDLDTSMQDDLDVFTGTVPGGVSFYQDALFSNWEQDYDQILTELVSGPLSLSVISGELDRLSTVAGNAFDTDPWLTSGSGDAEDLRDWWTARHPAVVASVEAH
jgi:spore coat protein CotH